VRRTEKATCLAAPEREVLVCGGAILQQRLLLRYTL
jgi:hypothetical protein